MSPLIVFFWDDFPADRDRAGRSSKGMSSSNGASSAIFILFGLPVERFFGTIRPGSPVAKVAASVSCDRCDDTRSGVTGRGGGGGGGGMGGGMLEEALLFEKALLAKSVKPLKAVLSSSPPIMNRSTLVFGANSLSKLLLDGIPVVAVSNGTSTPSSIGVFGEGGMFIVLSLLIPKEALVPLSPVISVPADRDRLAVSNAISS
mmetsp:Transcript_34436/g.61868  ORF Transcript_34436/g.61868 Transcript_34436/m.61868 type:complete len:203 (+) Transcript_34436:405-1013(+)